MSADQLHIEDYDEDEALLEATHADGQPRLRVYRLPRPVIVLGRGSKPERELHLAACRADSVPLHRRRGGGCAVVVDPGNVVVAVVLPARGLGGSPRFFAALSAWIIAALARLGHPGIRREGSSDLVLGERKVGGACIYRARDLLYYAATLLVTPETALIERYLQHPPREPAYRGGRGHADFVGALAPGEAGAPARLEAALRRELQLGALLAALGTRHPGDDE